jgi:hypothetical protein
MNPSSERRVQGTEKRLTLSLCGHLLVSTKEKLEGERDVWSLRWVCEVVSVMEKACLLCVHDSDSLMANLHYVTTSHSIPFWYAFSNLLVN